MDQNFISQNEFQAMSSRVEKWANLPLKTIYRIDGIMEKTVDRNGEKVQSKYAVLSNREGEVTNVWLTSVIEKELNEYDVNRKEKVYIQSFGLKKSKNGNNSYYDFEIIKQ